VLGGIVLSTAMDHTSVDASKDYWGHKTFCIRCKRSSKRDVYVRMMEGAVAVEAAPKTVTNAAT
jgi:hypothetical protein